MANNCEVLLEKPEGVAPYLDMLEGASLLLWWAGSTACLLRWTRLRLDDGFYVYAQGCMRCTPSACSILTLRRDKAVMAWTALAVGELSAPYRGWKEAVWLNNLLYGSEGSGDEINGKPDEPSGEVRKVTPARTLVQWSQSWGYW
jgi:hypothetical protein